MYAGRPPVFGRTTMRSSRRQWRLESGASCVIVGVAPLSRHTSETLYRYSRGLCLDDQSTHRRCSVGRSLAVWAVVGLPLTLSFVVGTQFAAKFEFFGPPARSQELGWLGPTPRSAEACASDLGGFTLWTCSETIFDEHRVECEIWLRVNGLNRGE